MSFGTEFFIRGANDHVLAIVKDKYPTACITNGPRFLCVRLSKPDYEPPESFLRELSMQGELYWVSFSSSTDAFQYFHWDNGILRRALVYGLSAEQFWDIVSGEPEPWEREAFFPEDMLREYPSYARYHPDAAEVPHGSITECGSNVKIDSKDAWAAVWNYYHFWN